MPKDTPLPPSLDAPSAVVTYYDISHALIAPPSPASPILLRYAGLRNLLQDGAETSDTNKRAGEIPLTGHSPTKKKGGRLAWGTGGWRLTCRDGISPRNALNACKDNQVDASNGDLDDNGDENYLPTPAYKNLHRMTHKPKTCNSKVILDSSYYAFLHPLMFDTKWFSRGHPQVYSEEEMLWFNVDFQKQLTFNFCATRATRKKAVTINEAQASCMRDVDLDVTPALFSLERMDHILLCSWGCFGMFCWLLITCLHPSRCWCRCQSNQSLLQQSGKIHCWNQKRA